MADSRRLSLSFLGSLLKTRTATAICAGFAIAQLFLMIARLPAIPCWFYEWTGIPCPLCGISRAIGALFRGHIRESFAWHPFGPAAVLLAVLLCVAATLPEWRRVALSRYIQRIEERTAASAVLMLLLFVFWILRLAVPALALAQTTPTL